MQAFDHGIDTRWVEFQTIEQCRIETIGTTVLHIHGIGRQELFAVVVKGFWQLPEVPDFFSAVSAPAIIREASRAWLPRVCIINLNIHKFYLAKVFSIEKPPLYVQRINNV